MDVAAIQTLIGSLGFPIVCCGVLFWYLYTTQKQHKEESHKWTEALNNNTLVLQRLLDKMEDNDNE